MANRVLFRMPEPRRTRKMRFRRFKGCLLGPYYWELAHGNGTLGLPIHRKCAAFGAWLLFRSRIPFREICNLLFRPMDTVGMEFLKR